MPSLDSLPPLVVLVGPTAVGKTELAIQLAARLQGEIVSADSRLFYRGMDVGTAKPTPADRRRVPHHLIDIADPDETWSLALFQRSAAQAIAEIHARGKLPFLVGGTGQYVRAVIEDWRVPPQGPDLALRSALERWAGEVGSEGLHARLAVLDPQAAAAIDAPNVRRTMRALEVILRTGRKFSVQRQKLRSPYRLAVLGLTRPRSELYARIDARIEDMLANGFIDEVKRLLERGYSPALPTLSAIGYREMVAYLQGEMTLEEAVAQMKRLTRRFVRRQANWFKDSDASIHWFQIEDSLGDDGKNIVDEMEQFIRKWMRNPG